MIGKESIVCHLWIFTNVRYTHTHITLIPQSNTKTSEKPDPTSRYFGFIRVLNAQPITTMRNICIWKKRLKYMVETRRPQRPQVMKASRGNRCFALVLMSAASKCELKCSRAQGLSPNARMRKTVCRSQFRFPKCILVFVQISFQNL